MCLSSCDKEGTAVVPKYRLILLEVTAMNGEAESWAVASFGELVV